MFRGRSLCLTGKDFLAETTPLSRFSCFFFVIVVYRFAFFVFRWPSVVSRDGGAQVQRTLTSGTSGKHGSGHCRCLQGGNSWSLRELDTPVKACAVPAQSHVAILLFVFSFPSASCKLQARGRFGHEPYAGRSTQRCPHRYRASSIPDVSLLHTARRTSMREDFLHGTTG